ncbi:MAG: hypothetical protein U0869_00185 [Chloroflexota bacterium]
MLATTEILPAASAAPTATAARADMSVDALPWPGLFLVGAAMAGASRLRTELGRHPAIRFAEPEEPHHFSDVRPAPRFARRMPVVTDAAAYLRLFEGAPAGSLRAEASTSYLTSPETPDRIAAVAPDARIVILLRDPVERAWAHHRSDRAHGDERRGFLRAIRDELHRPARWGVEPVYLGAGRYADGLARYLDRFGPEHVWVRFSEWVAPDPGRAAHELVGWLGLDATGLAAAPTTGPDPASPTAATSEARRRGSWLDALRGRSTADASLEPAMDDTIRRLLEDVFAADVARVRDLLGVIPPWSVHPAS